MTKIQTIYKKYGKNEFFFDVLNKLFENMINVCYLV